MPFQPQELTRERYLSVIGLLASVRFLVRLGDVVSEQTHVERDPVSVSFKI